MNIERFNNELAMGLGYERIVKDRRIQISVEESDDPWVTLKVQGNNEIRFKVSGKADDSVLYAPPTMQNEIMFIVDTSHQAYMEASDSRF